MRSRKLLTHTALVAFIVLFASFAIAQASAGKAPTKAADKHVILISIDGFHALDLAVFLKSHPTSTFAELSKRGTIYTNARVPVADSSPGLLALVTGGSPNSTGVFYSDVYDRSLSPPASDCKTMGTAVIYDETANKNPNAEDAGGGLDPNRMPRDPKNSCSLVYPHQFLKVNTIFEIVKAAGGRTAWADQHPTYGDFMQGPSGAGVDDLYTPEAHVPGLKQNIDKSIAHDELKVKGLLNELAGKDHPGATAAAVPELMGMTFISVSVAQKLKGNGYIDGSGTPSPGVVKAMEYVDQSIGRMVAALKQANLYDSTMFVISAKHGQSPIDLKKLRIIDEDAVPDAVNEVQKDLVAHATVDTVAFLWLKDQSKTTAVVEALRAKSTELGIQEIYSGERMKLLYRDPLID